MIYEYEIDGLTVRTGDIICTSDGAADTDIKGQFWRLLGKIIPGEVDHIIIYVGPNGRCVEAGAKGRVITFEIMDTTWDFQKMIAKRGIIDTLYGAAYPLQGKSLSETEITGIREAVAAYCLRQAELEKPYNMNFLDSTTEDAYYCSQLAYLAYFKHGIDLNTGKGIPEIPGTERIIFPQEIWSGCGHKKAR
ncbi:MAG TPA: hypothetical protein DHV16_11285 [Nitrospiraceae bacterium]|nr:MAG: hypothetical protein A2Z82_02805 [Nitrospirae bacterium GWA2_46_11]OGW25734.1 MAG: hypothetical protein A2X55_11540 [Nitrospirae bacterium GWB2_47_37]HAK87984.1 hypothetical protein [Nitrospiraceae bacterium]HCZ12802.1 hypothetical protein [Nitrospiraceae bacterium]